MTILLHGDNITASRQRLLELKGVELDPKNPVISQNSLFGDKELFIIWLDQKVTTTQLKTYQQLFPGLQIEEFKLPAIVFAFLDALKPGNQRIFMPLWEKYLQNEAPEVAFTMIVRQFRLMLDPSGLAPWQAEKIKNQAKLFDVSKIYKKLLEIDYQNKTGQATLDLWLLSL